MGLFGNGEMCGSGKTGAEHFSSVWLVAGGWGIFMMPATGSPAVEQTRET